MTSQITTTSSYLPEEDHHSQTKLYDREVQLRELQDAYSRCCSRHSSTAGSSTHKNELVLITGASGVGKSALARALRHRVDAEGGFFVSGKLEYAANTTDNNNIVDISTANVAGNNGCNKPYGPFLQIVEDFLNQISSSNSSTRRRGENNNKVSNIIAESIREAVGSELFLLLQAIPSLEDFLTSTSNPKEDEQQEEEKEVAFSSSGNLHQTNNTTSDESSFISGHLDLDSSSDDSSFKVGISTPNPARFATALVTLFRAIASALVAPLVLLCDDLQWIDESSLDILTQLVTEKANNNLLVIGTCRGNEVSKHDLLSTKLRQIEEDDQHDGLGCCQITDIQVSALSKSAVACLLADMLGMYYSQVVPLAEIVSDHTGGNVFFVKQCLQNLIDEGILHQAEQEGQGGCCWKWEEAALVLALPSSSAEATSTSSVDSVVKLLAGKLQQQSTFVVEVVKTIACLGGIFTESILFHALGGPTMSQSQLMTALKVATDNMGFISCDFNTGTGHFTHDKFREAALSLLINHTEKNDLHMKIGRNLRRQLPLQLVKANVILIADQLKHGLDLVADPEERDDFARIFLRAGREAAKKSAFTAASQYIDYGLSILSPRHWRDQYNLSLDLYGTGAEMAYCIGNHEKVDAFATEVSLNARSIGDRNRALITHLMSYASSGQPGKGVNLCWSTLKDLKQPVPRRPGPITVLLEILRVQHAIGKRTEEDILALPPLQDPQIIAAMNVMYIMNNLLECSKCEEGAWLPVLRLVRLTFRHGLSPLAALGFHLYSLYLVKTGQLDDACRFDRLAMRILERFPSKQLQGQIIFLSIMVVQGSKNSFRAILEPMVKAGETAMEAGYMEHGMAGSTFSSCFGMFLGDPIADCVKVLAKYEGLCRIYGQHKIGFVASCVLQVCQNLQGGVKNPLNLTGNWMNEEETVGKLKGHLEHVLIIVIYCKYIMLTILSENQSAAALYEKYGASLKGFILPFFSVHGIFCRGLVSAALARTSSGWIRRRKMAEAKQQYSELKKKWLVHCPDNIANKLYLIDAELEFCQGRHSAALLKYEQAISHAEKEGFISEQALACEKAGRMLRNAGRYAEAANYFEKARLLYLSWGAQLKVDQMEEKLVQVQKRGEITGQSSK